MSHPDIVTLTLNSSLDKSTTFTGLVAEQKIRCTTPHYDAGGGGINVSKAINRLGGDSLCVFTCGGSSGELVSQLIASENIATHPIRVANATRESLVALETGSNAQYRFGFPGAPLLPQEIDRILEDLRGMRPRFLVASGSLNEGLADDFYQKIAAIAKENGAKFIIDTSGEPLRQALNTGVFLVKPNIGELAKLVGVDRIEIDDADDAARELINNKLAEIVVVSLGPQGAVVVSADETLYVPAPHVKKRSTVGAGDSMVGGMVWALSQDMPLGEVARWGVACGTAATMNDGTQLFKAEDAKRLYDWLKKRS